MVKTTGPLLSINAHGQLAKTLNYSQRKEGNIGRQFHYPHKEPSQKQYTRRTILGLLTAHWQCMTAAQKLVWENATILGDLNISGFNYFIQSAIADLKTHHGLCGYWSFNELTGATAYDYSGNENHGTLMPSFPSDVPSRVDSINTKFGKALSFDGINDYVEGIKTIGISGNAEFSFDAWFKATSVGNYDTIIGLGNINIPGQAAALVVMPSRAVGGSFAGAQNAHTAADAIVTGKWYHLVFTKAPGAINLTARVYLNGVHTALSGPATSTPNITNTYPKIGNLFANFHGVIDEARIYNRALSPQEVMKHYELLRRPNRRQIRLV